MTLTGLATHQIELLTEGVRFTARLKMHDCLVNPDKQLSSGRRLRYEAVGAELPNLNMENCGDGVFLGFHLPAKKGHIFLEVFRNPCQARLGQDQSILHGVRGMEGVFLKFYLGASNLACLGRNILNF
jgi:hypothetical protein